MKRHLAFFLATISLGVITFLAIRQVQYPASASAGPNFLATAIERRFDLSGREIHTENLLRAVGDDGFVDIVQRQDPLGRPVELKSVVIYSARKRIAVDPMTESITTYSLTPGEVTFYKSPKPNCTNEANPQTTTIAGYTAVRFVVPIPQSAFPQKTTWEQWLAPQLGCFLLRSQTFLNDSGAPLGTREVIFVALGDPPSSLFQIPQHYTERSPGEVFAEFARRFPNRCVSCEKTPQVLDDVYRKRH